MANVQCFMLEPTERVRQKLRRYHSSAEGESCPANPGKYSYHNAEMPIEDAPAIWDENHEYIRNSIDGVSRYEGDPRWPTHCACGYAFTEDDPKQLFDELIYRRADTGEETTLRDAPAGAMWYAPWMDSWSHPQLAHTLIVKLPDGTEWCVDGQASNCTRPGDVDHKCWVIEGTTPPLITVSKNGVTCAAGAGSIQSTNYHGFLRNGVLEGC